MGNLLVLITIASTMSYHAVLLASDWHIGEVISTPENQYDIKVASRRVETLAARFLKWQETFPRPKSVILVLLGDLISGNIHFEYLLTQSTSPLEQCLHARNLIRRLVDRISKKYPVEIYGMVTDNHARLYRKPIHKAKAKHNYNLLILQGLQDDLEGKVPVRFWETLYAVQCLADRHYLFTHGDHIRSSGLTFVTAITRFKDGVYKRAKMTSQVVPDYFVLGHFHTPVFYDDLIVNGSLSGMSEYDLACHRTSTPCQVAFHATPFGVRNFTVLHVDA